MATVSAPMYPCWLSSGLFFPGFLESFFFWYQGQLRQKLRNLRVSKQNPPAPKRPPFLKQQRNAGLGLASKAKVRLRLLSQVLLQAAMEQDSRPVGPELLRWILDGHGGRLWMDGVQFAPLWNKEKPMFVGIHREIA